MEVHRSYCPMNLAMEVFGDKWTLLIIRDMMFDGKRYFREFLHSDERIASNILTARLNMLEREGIVTKSKDKHHKQKYVYSLTKMGIDLLPILTEIGFWSTKYRPVADPGKTHAIELKNGGEQRQIQIKDQLKAVHIDELLF